MKTTKLERDLHGDDRRSRAWRSARSTPASRARSCRRHHQRRRRQRCARHPARYGSPATTTGGSAATMATAWTSSPRRPSTRRAKPRKFQVRMPFREAHGAGHGRARGRAVELRRRPDRQGSGDRGADARRLCARRLRLGDGGARACRAAGGLAARTSRAAGSCPSRQDGGKPTATVDLAKPSYRIGIAKVKVGWEGAPARRRREGGQASLWRARHRDGRRRGQGARRQARAHRPRSPSPRSTRPCSSSRPTTAGTC